MGSTRDFFHKLSFQAIVWALCILLFFLPVLVLPDLFIYPFETSKYLFLSFSAGLLLILYFIFIITAKSDGKKPLFFIPSLIAPIIFLAVAKILSFIFSINLEASLIGLPYFSSDSVIHLVSLISIFFVTSQIARENQVKKQLITYTYAGILLTAVAGLYQYFHIQPWNHNWVYRIRSTIGEPNRLAFTLEAGLWLGILLFALEKHKRFRKIINLSLFLIFVCWILTFTRSAQISLVLTGLIIILTKYRYVFRQIFAENKSLFIIFGVGIVILWPLLISQWRGTFFPPVDITETSPYIRMEEWKSAWQVIINRSLPRQIIGQGPETISTVLNSPLLPDNKLSQIPFAENIKIRNYWLHILTNEGLLSLAAWVFLLVATVRLVIKNNSRFSYFLGFATAGIIIHAFLYYLPISVSLYFWLFLGIVASSSKQHFNLPKSFIFSFFLKAGFLFTGLLILYFAAGTTLLVLREDKRKNLLSENLLLVPYSAEVRRNNAQNHWFEAIGLKDIDRIKSEREIALAIKDLNKAFYLNSYNGENYTLATKLYYWAGAYLDKKYHTYALDYGGKLPSLAPVNPLSYDRLGLIYLDLGQLETARGYFQKAIETNPGYVGAYLHSGEVLKQQGKFDEAIGYYKKALEIQPGWDFAQNEIDKVVKLKNPER